MTSIITRDSAGLDRIDEDKFTQTQVASPVAENSRSDYFDFASRVRRPRRRSTDPVSPSSTEKGLSATKAPSLRAATTYVPTKQNSTEPKKTTLGSIGNTFRRILPGKQNNFAEAGPSGIHPRRGSTIYTNYSASFEDTAIWDRKAILSLGKRICLARTLSHH